MDLRFVEGHEAIMKIQVNNIEELSNGAVFCQILDIIGAETVRMQKINWNAKL